MLIAPFVAVAVGVFVALWLSFLSDDTNRLHRRARARDLANYRHLPDANLLQLND